MPSRVMTSADLEAAGWSDLFDAGLVEKGVGRPRFADLDALAAAIASGARASLAIMTDSTGRGWGSNGLPSGAGVAGDANNNRLALAWPQQLAGLLEATGLPSRSDAIFGSGNTTNNTAAEAMAANPILGLGAGWTPIGTISLGGRIFENTADLSSFTGTPTKSANAMDLLYVQNTGYAQFTVTDPSGTLDTVTAAGSLAVIKRTVTRGISSTAPFSVQKVAGDIAKTIRLIGAVFYDTTKPMFEIWNMGAGGFATTNWLSATTAVAPYNAMIVMPPTQWIVELGANDIAGGVADATFETNLRNLVDRALSVAPTSLAIPPSARDGSGTYNIPAGYLTAIANIKAARDAMTPTLNFRGRSGLVVADYFDSSVHMTRSGNAKRAYAAQTWLA